MAELDRQPKFTGGGRMWKWLTIESFIHESQEYKEAWDFQLRHEFREDVNYDWILPYANEENKRCQATLDSVDSKADSLIRYLGAGSAFVSLFLLYAKPEGEHLIWVIAPTLLLLFLSLGCAVIARSPQAHPKSAFYELGDQTR